MMRPILSYRSALEYIYIICKLLVNYQRKKLLTKAVSLMREFGNFCPNDFRVSTILCGLGFRTNRFHKHFKIGLDSKTAFRGAQTRSLSRHCKLRKWNFMHEKETVKGNCEYIRKKEMGPVLAIGIKRKIRKEKRESEMFLGFFNWIRGRRKIMRGMEEGN